MKRSGGIVFLLFVTLVSFVLAACAPSEAEVAQAVEATLQAMVTDTPTATLTPEPTFTPTPEPPTATPTVTPTKTPKPSPTPTRTPLPPLFPDVEPLGCEMDEFQGIEWCTKYSTPGIDGFVLDFNGSGSADFALYTGKGGGSPVLRWEIAYVGDDWIFIDAITVMVDGQKYTIPVDNYQNVKSDVLDGGSVAEVFDREVSSKKLALAIAFADDVKVRLSGKGGNFDKTLTDREKDIVRRALKTYEDKGGYFNLIDLEGAGVIKE